MYIHTAEREINTQAFRISALVPPINCRCEQICQGNPESVRHLRKRLQLQHFPFIR